MRTRKPITVHEAFQKFIFDKTLFKGISKSTEHHYTKTLNVMKVPQDLLLTDFKKFMENKILEFQQKNLSKHSINTYITWYNAIINFCLDNDIIKPNRPKTWRIKHVLVSKSLPKALSSEDIAKLKRPPKSILKHFTNYRDYTAAMTIFYTGLRRKEISQLKLADINMQEHKMLVRDTKGRRDRIAFVVSSLKPVLANYLTMLRARFPETEYVFPSSSGTKWETNTMHYNFKKLGQQLGLSCILSPHKLRHTFCIQAVRNGADISQIKEFAGHADIKTTQKYLVFDEETLKESAERFLNF